MFKIYLELFMWDDTKPLGYYARPTVATVAEDELPAAVDAINDHPEMRLIGVSKV